MPRIAVIWFVMTLMAWSAPELGRAQNHPRQQRDVSETRQSKSDTGDEAKVENTPSAPSAKPERSKAVQPYRLDFAVNELQDGNKVNSRHYSMDLTTGSADEIKIGTRVPVPTGPHGTGVSPTSFQYMDVGTTIWALLRESGDDWQLQVKSEISDIDKSPRNDQGAELGPIVRQMKIEGSTLLVTGKPMVIGTLDDPNSRRQFQLEVTATRLR
jgi:hypothetical protein